jgi:hypothetical protein
MWKNGGSVTLANTNTWKTTSFHLTDAYFGNRENGGADFRFGNISGSYYYLDNIRVMVTPPQPPIIAEVMPEPKLAYPGIAYSEQLAMIQDCPKSTLTLVQGPLGLYLCESNSRVLGWTPGFTELGDHTIVVQADNSGGSDTETWVVRVISQCDYDADGDVDQSDFGFLQNCLSNAPAVPACDPADLYPDGYVDQTDLLQFMPCIAGPNHPPGC